MKKQTNEKLSNLIVERYGKFDSDTMKRFFLEEFFVSSRARKIDEQDYSLILEEITKLVDAQNLKLEDIDYLGFGQRYTALGIGNAVIKIGNTTEKVYDNPFRLTPVYKRDLKENLGLYVSQRAKCGNISKKSVQEMYNAIRDAGGVWLDVKAENLGYVQGKMDFSLIYPKTNEAIIVQDKEFSSYTGNCFIVDYEDVIFLTPELREQMLRFEAPNINSVPRQLLLDEIDNDEIYFQGFIKNSNKLLEYERNYQRQKGNRNQEKRCIATIRENNRNVRQIRYVEEQRYIHGRNYSEIGAKFSAKEIGMQVMQKTNIHRLQNIVKTIGSKMREIRDRHNISNTQIAIEENADNSRKQLNEPDITEFISPIDMYDPYSTR